jgi:Spy/CpxP family protein refolding chaperone
MKRRLPWILLTLSLILNAALIGGAVYVKQKAEHYRENPEARAEYLVDRLELDQTQAAALEEMMQNFSEMREQRQEARESFREKFMALLAQPKLTREDVERELRAGTGAWIDRFADKMLEMHAFVSTLTPEQREELFALAREHRGGLRRLFQGGH